MKKFLQLYAVFLLLLFVACGSNVEGEQPAENYNGNNGGEYYNPSIEQEPNDGDNNAANGGDYTPYEQGSSEGDTNNENLDITGQNPSDEPREIAEPPIGILAVIDRMANSTSTWAKTTNHFFFVHTYFDMYTWEHEHVLYRLPLSNISRGERVALPTDDEIEILGICNNYLFISRMTGDWFLQSYNIYRISLLTLETTFIDTGVYYGVPFFHRASNSILFARRDSNEPTVQLEALRLNTGARDIFFEFNSFAFDSGTGWLLTEDGSVLFVNSSWGAIDPWSDFILIDAGLNAKHILFDEIDWAWDWGFQEPMPPQNPAEEFLYELGAFPFGIYAIMGNRIFYAWCEVWGSWGGSLYSINLDGTQNTLLQESISIETLLVINNTLFATIFVDTYLDVALNEAVVLTGDGHIAKVIGGGMHGHNSAFDMVQLMDTNFVMVMQLSFFRVDGNVVALYCTATGALFSPSPSN